MEKLLDEISFSADALHPQKVTVDTEYVNLHLGKSGEKRDLAKYIL